ncbi:hypothetical protein CQJ94_16750 [Glycomyces fuscus]|nr:hypothetical protein CQJ94_16750 [Glycomyces fuscus]
MTMQSRTSGAVSVRDSSWSASARGGSPAEAWEALVEEFPETPVFGRSGHGLTCHPVTGSSLDSGTAVVGALSLSGRQWTLLARLDPPDDAWSPSPEWLVGVASIRLGLSLWLRDQAVARLRRRKAGGTALVHQQLVRSDLAQAATEQTMAESLLEGPMELPEVLTASSRASRHLTSADRTLLRLFGASGFLDVGPGQVAYLSELIADAYLESGTVDVKGGHSDRVG